MKYYKLTQIENRPNIITPLLPSFTELWSESTPFFMPGKAKAPFKELDFLPFYQSKCFVISDTVQKIWKNYQEGGRYRPCAMGSVEQRKVGIYAVMQPKLLDAIHEKTEYFKNGAVKTLVLDREKVGYNKVFGIKFWHHTTLIITGDILEEMLQEYITEVHWEEVGIL